MVALCGTPLATVEFENEAIPPSVHCANQRISLDLDDGVKVNCDKFGQVLSAADNEIKTLGKKLAALERQNAGSYRNC
jgi:hypothetical protein